MTPDAQRAPVPGSTDPVVLRTVLACFSDPVAAIGPDYRYIAVNRSYSAGFERLFGRPVSPGDSLEEKLSHLPGELEKAVAAWARALAGERFTIEQELGAGDLARGTFAITFDPILDDRGAVTGAVHILRDVTGRVSAEARMRRLNLELEADAAKRTAELEASNTALRASEERLRIAQRAGGIGTFEWNPDSGRVTVSEEFCRIWGIEPCETVSSAMLVGMVRAEDRGMLGTARLDTPDTALDYVEYRVRQPVTGEERWVARRGERVKGREGEPARFVGVVYDVTDLRAAEERQREGAQALRETAERYRLASRATNDAIWDWDLVQDHVQWNEAIETAFGHQLGTVEPTGAWWIGHIHPDDRARIDRSIRAVIDGTGIDWTNEYRFLCADGSHADIYDRGYIIRDPSGRAVRMIGAMLDLTKRKRAEAALRSLNATLENRIAEAVAEREKAQEQVRQLQKLEAVGQLTGGMAHDFNNLLQAISGCLQLVGRRTSEPAIRPLLDIGRQAVDRGAKLVQQLLAFARQQSLRPEAFDIRNRLLGMIGLLERALRADIRLELDIAAGLWPAEADPTQFELSMLNLAVNARDAMPAGGRLVVGAANTVLSDHGAEGLTGDFVRITVTDDGTGMTPDIASRVFEPFFTTKDVGKGTGLGLAQVYGFARQSGGTAFVESEPGRGTTVTLLLPRSTADRDEAANRPDGPPAARSGRVLLVEDDPVVVPVVCAALEEMGYEVSHAGSGTEALARLRAGEAFDLLFSDVMMPGGVNGVELAREARRLRPSLPVVLTTGYSGDVAGADGMRVLAKPYRVEELAAALETELGGVGD